jgi:GTP cyclohydrolase IA
MSVKFQDEQILAGITAILNGLGLDVNSPNFKDTPQRVLKSYYEIFNGEGEHLEEAIKELFSKAFPSDYSGIVIVNKIEVFSMCPHHLLPVEYSVDVGYISKTGQMLGISKLPRLVELLASRLVLQETLTDDIVKNLMRHLRADGAIAIVKGKHMCVRMRGVYKPDSDTITSSVAGTFEVDLGARQEFLQLVNR